MGELEEGFENALLTSVDNTRNSITNPKRKIGVLPGPNPYYFARVICSTDCPNICATEVRVGL
jgi:hypothetical protein